ncbi:MAG: MotA/TolQ/ExbB proton channel family protein [Chthoniobacterales bacterium]
MVVPIILGLIGTILLIVNSATRTSAQRIGPLGDEETVRALFRQSDFAGADDFCRTHPSALAKILRAGICLIGSGQQAVKDGVEAALATERLRLHTRFSYLHALGLCMPLVGLLGTLVGFIRALLKAPDTVSALTPELGAALVPSALGLVAGIVATAAFYILRERAAAAMLRLQEAVHAIFRQLPYDSLAGLDVGTHE